MWWPNIDKHIEQKIGSCSICNVFRSSPPRAPLAHWSYPERPWERIHLDMFSLNNKNFLVAVDAYSKWVECFIMSTTDSEAVVLRVSEMFSRFGLVKVIVTDNGTNFCSAYFENFCQRNGVKHVTIAPYHPASNGQAENTVKTFKRSIQVILNEGSSKMLVDKLYEYLFNYRNSAHCTTGVSPAELMFGRKLRCRLDLLCERSTVAGGTSPTSESLSSVIKDNVHAKQISQSNAYGGHRKIIFKTGDEVLFKHYYKNGTKHTYKFGIIKKNIGSRMYLVYVPEQNVYVRKHIDQILIYKGSKKYNEHVSDDVSCFGDYTSNEVTESSVPGEHVTEQDPPQLQGVPHDSNVLSSPAPQQEQVEEERSESVPVGSDSEGSSVTTSVSSPSAPIDPRSDDQLTPRRYPLRIRKKHEQQRRHRKVEKWVNRNTISSDPLISCIGLAVAASCSVRFKFSP
ncbi:unnamed protein product [Colias eurytheme]|nr:unnamed protein product [Colias eurytheme]